MGGTMSTVDMNGKEAQFIKSTVTENPVVVFSKTTCPYCNTAKSIFTQIGVDAKVYELDRREDGPLLQDILGAMTKARTVPRVFIRGECIGGCSELQTLHRNGQLEGMLSR